jgi:hypothetical protein
MSIVKKQKKSKCQNKKIQIAWIHLEFGILKFEDYLRFVFC